MKELLLLLTVVGTIGGNGYGEYQPVTPDLNDQIQVVMNSAKYYLNENAPSITSLFFIDNPDTIVRLERKLKVKILNDLLNWLVNVWAKMNMMVVKGNKVLKRLRDEAETLTNELKAHGLRDVLDSDDAKQRMAERVKQLLKDAKQVLCVRIGNLTGLELAEKRFLELTSNLEHRNVKYHLLKSMYSYQIETLRNVSIPLSEHVILNDVWEVVRAWGKWTILGLMAFIEEPLNDLHEEVEKHVTLLLNDMEQCVEKILEYILELVAATGNENYNEEMLKLFATLDEADNALYLLCN